MALPLPAWWCDMVRCPYFGVRAPAGSRKEKLPLAEPCFCCGSGFTAEDHGFYLAIRGVDSPELICPVHLECFVLSIMGNKSHKEHTCGCHVHLAGDDDQTLTPHQQAVESYLCWFNTIRRRSYWTSSEN